MNGTQNLGPLTPFHPPSLEAARAYNVNREGQNEVIWQPQYDIQTYDAAGVTQIVFFQNPVGVGGNTLADTSMRSAGQLPAPQEFLVVGIQVLFVPGNTVAAASLDATTAQENWNDVSDVMFGNAYLELFIGSKPYLQDGPLAKFTQQFRLGGVANQAYTGTNATPIGVQVDYAVHSGRYYSITPVKLPTTQNFDVKTVFPSGAIAVNTDATIGVILDGFLYRLSQ